MKINPSSRPHLDHDHSNEDKLQKGDGFEKPQKPYIDRSGSEKGQNIPLDKRKTRRKGDRRNKKISDRKTQELDEAFDEEWDDDIDDEEDDLP
ncbi:hypothetical protein [Endozoicomonas ascidiicola]|uniref:hypothetical protein n=1 Tax=Endozoicomonas ascidiicola TaxID=1698521 RepID=UPI000830E2F7|nr:hypothetical protein [Endozoicomonas ascidiicola]